MIDFSFRDEGIFVAKLGSGRKITIPQEMCEATGLHEGDFIGLKVTPDGVVVLSESGMSRVVFKALSRREGAETGIG